MQIVRPWSLCSLTVPAGAHGVVLLAHAHGRSPHGQGIAEILQAHGLATLRIELLSEAELCDATDSLDIGLLAARWDGVLAWACGRTDLSGLAIGLLADGMDAAAALYLAATAASLARRSGRVAALVSTGGRLDLLGAHLAEVDVPTLLLVGSDDPDALAHNRQGLLRLTCRKRLEVVPGAGPLFDQQGARDVVSQLAAGWFETHLAGAGWN